MINSSIHNLWASDSRSFEPIRDNYQSANEVWPYSNLWQVW